MSSKRKSRGSGGADAADADSSAVGSSASSSRAGGRAPDAAARAGVPIKLRRIELVDELEGELGDIARAHLKAADYAGSEAAAVRAALQDFRAGAFSAVRARVVQAADDEEDGRCLQGR
jgi:hypothetical protein